MKKLYLLFAAVLITWSATAAVASPMDITALDNKDVVSMVEHGLGADAIIKAIKSSPCTFDTFPPVMKELKRRGVPEAVLEAMLDAPYGPAATNRTTEDAAADEPIYHFTESIKQYLTPVATGRRYNPTASRTRASRVRR